MTYAVTSTGESAFAPKKQPVYFAGRSLIEELEARTLLSIFQPDPTFAAGGQFQPTASGAYNDMVALPDGRVLAAGYTTVGSNHAVFVSRLLASGKPDPTFGTSGRIIVQPAGIAATGYRLALTAGGEFYVAGDVLLRFNSNGALDKTFGSAGIVRFNDGSASAQAAIVLQADGKVVVLHGGQVSRYTSYGTLDTSFANHGHFTNFNSAIGNLYTSATPRDLLMYGSRILVGVLLANSTAHAVGAEALTPAGVIDSAFGDGRVAPGLIVADRDGVEADFSHMRVSSDGTLAFVGKTTGVADFIAGRNLVNFNGFSGASGAGYGADLLFPTPDNPLYCGRLDQGNGVGALFVADSLGAYGPLPVIPLSPDFTLRTMVMTGGGKVVVCGMVNGRPWMMRLVPTGTTTVPYATFLYINLIVSGTDGDDTIDVSRSGSNILVSINGRSYGAFPLSGFPRTPPAISVMGLSGNDKITVHAGNISVIVDGGPGNDTITGGGGPNLLVGGPGNDILSPGISASNDIYGGDGFDIVDYASRSKGVEVHLDGTRDSGNSGEHDLIAADIEDVYGTAYNDTIFGNFGNLGARGTRDALYGMGGNDVIYAGNGGDSVYGGDGNDQLFARNDVVDYVDGGAGADSARVNPMDDIVTDVESFIA